MGIRIRMGAKIKKNAGAPKFVDTRDTPGHQTRFLLFSNIRNLVQGRFFYFLEWCVQIVLLSHLYHNTVIPMSEQQQSCFALRSPAAVWRARGSQQKHFFAKPSGLE